MAASQLPPIGAHPSAGVVFLGALLWSSPSQAAEVLAHVDDSDMATPSLSLLLAAVRRLVNAGTPPAPQLVSDDLQRVGNLKQFAAKDLHDATTSGATPEALRQYAAAVVASSFRRRIESAGVALSGAAVTAAEADLAPIVSRASASCLDCAARLGRLRGEST